MHSAPRLPSECELVPLKMKRKLSFKGHYLYDYVSPERLTIALHTCTLVEHFKQHLVGAMISISIQTSTGLPQDNPRSFLTENVTTLTIKTHARIKTQHDVADLQPPCMYVPVQYTRRYDSACNRHLDPVPDPCMRHAT